MRIAATGGCGRLGRSLAALLPADGPEVADRDHLVPLPAEHPVDAMVAETAHAMRIA
jgi:hypothetical protein